MQIHADNATNLILKTDRGYFSLIVSGDYGRVDLETIKEIIAQEVRFAKPKEVEEATGSRIGSVSLINPTSEIHLKGIDHNDSVHCQ
ncbi:YbaK/EbsC family protein [Paenibacillus barengoltzii]|uniref:YbaK/EbsC family protein n=1 Tax=Paenibacillus barengoltzii TaxID=343517 RepID=UPI002DB95E5D|nr:YbaK/EbsC family protein [Paenibacillus barengoltzii]MEC2344009.1 YbaK/EbsC family protein [Paenibacillus barengoltzii]